MNFPWQPHPNPRLQTAWNSAQLAFFLLPFSPLCGGLGILFASILTSTQQWHLIHRRWPNQALAVLSLWFICTACLSRDRTQAFIGLLNFIPFFLIFPSLSSLIQTPTQLRRLAWLIVIPSVPITLIGWGQLFWGWTGPIKLWFLIQWPLDANGLPPGRMAAIFAHANVFASYLIVLFILTLGLWLNTWQSLKTRPKHPQTAPPPPTRNIDTQREHIRLNLSLLSLTLIATSIALLLSNSRNAWAVTILACLAFALYQGWRWLVATVAAAAAATLGAAFAPPPLQPWLRNIIPAFFWERLADRSFDRPIGTLRTTQWHFAGSLTAQRPWTGWGLRNFAPLYQQHTQVWMSHPHNLFLMLAAETGIPATLILCTIVGWILARGVRLLQKTALATEKSDWERRLLFTYLLAFGACTLFNTLDVTLFDLRINLLGWTLLAAIYGLCDRNPSHFSRSQTQANHNCRSDMPSP